MSMVFLTNPWPSATVRGRQIAERLDDANLDDANINISVKPDDTVICIKSVPTPQLTKHVSKCYVDVVDSMGVLNILRQHPNIDAIPIAITKSNQRFIENYLHREAIVVPQQHCNFENVIRDRDDVKVVGFCGCTDTFDLSLNAVANALREIGLEFVAKFDLSTRQEVVDFYKSIDINLCYRVVNTTLKNHLKIINAGSFKIPTVAFPEPAYVEDA